MGRVLRSGQECSGLGVGTTCGGGHFPDGSDPGGGRPSNSPPDAGARALERDLVPLAGTGPEFTGDAIEPRRGDSNGSTALNRIDLDPQLSWFACPTSGPRGCFAGSLAPKHRTRLDAFVSICLRGVWLGE